MTREERREHIRRQVDEWPPFTPQQRARLTVLLQPEPQPRTEAATAERAVTPKAA